MVELDARGFSCPIPVVKAKKTMDENRGAEVIVLVDSSVALENVSRMAKSQGYTVKTEKAKDGFRLILSPPVK